MYEKFLERNTDCISQTVDDAFIAQYTDIAPESLITLWKEVGLGMFCDKILSNNITLLFNKCVFNKSILEAWFKVERYAEIKDKVGLPQLDECFGYVPALALGGTETDDNIQIIKTVPYIEIITQSIGEFKRIR